jgi:tetratricopeptide (TPR) repeat protein
MFERAAADPPGTLAAAELLVGKTHRAGDRRAQVRALCALAWAERSLLRVPSAKRHLDRAVQLAVDHRVDRIDRVEALNCRAAVYQDLGRYWAARRDLFDAQRLIDQELAVSDHDRVEIARSAVRVRSQLATLLQNAGRLPEAESLYRQVLQGQAVTDRIQAIVGNNLALLLAQSGRHREAMEVIDRVGACAVAAGPAVNAALLMSRAWVTVQSGRLAEAMRLFDVAAAAIAETGTPLAVAEYQVEQVDALLDLRLIPEALAAAKDALRQFEASGANLMVAEARLRLAQVAVVAGLSQEALSAALTAEEEFRIQRRPGWRTRAQLVAAEARIALGELAEADLARTRTVARKLQSQGFVDASVRAHLVAGQLAAALGRRRQAVQSFAGARAGARRAPILVRLNGHLAAAWEAELRRRPGEALRHCRRGLELLGRHRAELPTQRQRATASGHGTELARIGLEIAVRQSSPRLAFAWMERTRAAAMTTVRTATLRTDVAAIRGRLTEEVLVEYAVLDGRVVAVVLSSDRITLLELSAEAPVRAEAAMLEFALRRLVRTGPGPGERAALARARLAVDRLRGWLIPKGLDPEQPLVVAPAGSLHPIPWPSLHAGPVTLAPSAGLWSRTLGGALGPPRTVALIAGPGLPGAVDEVRRLQAVHAAADALVPPHSTVDAAVRALGAADLAHVACHGTMRADNPMFSALQLQDGSLTAQTLEGGRFGPPRMVLSACSAASDVSLPGGEQLGFVSALLTQGTRGLIASLNLVPDLDVVDFMVRVHADLRRGRTVAQALHAGRSMLDQDDPLGLLVGTSFVAYGAG